MSEQTVLIGVSEETHNELHRAYRRLQNNARMMMQTLTDRNAYVDRLERENERLRAVRVNWPALWAGTLAAMSLIGNAVLLARLWGA